MGLFSSKKIISVASTVYNMAGVFEDRPNYLKTTVAKGVLTNTYSQADNITRSELSGPNLDQRAFFRWGRSYYPQGKITGNISKKTELTADQRTIVRNNILADTGNDATLVFAFVDAADASYFAERHILRNRQVDYETAWIADWDDDTDQIKIVYPDGSEELVNDPDYEEGASYVYAFYLINGAPSDSNKDMYIYKLGSGNVTLDTLDVASATLQEFLPIIPLRHYNKPVDDDSFAADYPSFKRAYKKSVGQNISTLLESIEDNPSIDDIDHCFLVHGVEINTQHREGLRYMYEFFSLLMQNQPANAVEDMLIWSGDTSYLDTEDAYTAWETGQYDPTSPYYGMEAPERTIYRLPEVSTVHLKSETDNLQIPFDWKIEWIGIREEAGSGLGKADAEKNDLWWEVMPDLSDPNHRTGNAPDERDPGNVFRPDAINVSHVRLFWQVTDNSFKYLDIYGLEHINNVYAGRSVTIKSKDGIQDEEESGFIVPMHYETMKRLPLVWANELAVQNRILVFNSYAIFKKKWYQRGFFKILFVVVIAVIASFVFPGAVGLLGSHLAVGSALGLAGTSALIVGAAVNVIAGIVLSQVITLGSQALFGDELGQIVGAVIATAFSMGVLSFQNGMLTLNFSNIFTGMSRADILLSLTNSASTLSNALIQIEANNLQDDFSGFMESYNNEIEKIEEKFLQLGYSEIEFDPLWLTQQGSSGYDNRSFESSSTFLTRTLLTGPDIVNITLNMVEKFPEISINLPEAIE